MNCIIRILYKIISSCERVNTNIISRYLKSAMGKCGKNVTLCRNCRISGVENTYMGDNIYIGPDATFLTTESCIIMGSNIMLGPNVSIITGDHRMDVVGKYMIDIHEKLPENDQNVIIEDDVWIGANVTILKGVRIGRGSIVGACSLVVKDIPQYSVYVGVPEQRMRERFDTVTISKHEELLKMNSFRN